MKKLHLDIETAPNLAYTWGLFKQDVGINQIVKPGYTLCFAAKWDGEKRVYFKSVHHHGMEAMLDELWALLDEADVVVHYNGKRFDIPTINREFVLWGYEPPSPYHQVDLLSTVRSQFRFSSNKLDFVCQQLGLGGKVQHKGMELWRDCMDGKASAWRVMKEYNIQDVRLLEELYMVLLPWIKKHPNMGLWLNSDEPTCRNCGSKEVVKKGIERTSTQTYQRYKCKDCGTNLRGRTRLEKTGDGVLV